MLDATGARVSVGLGANASSGLRENAPKCAERKLDGQIAGAPALGGNPEGCDERPKPVEEVVLQLPHCGVTARDAAAGSVSPRA